MILYIDSICFYRKILLAEIKERNFCKMKNNIKRALSAVLVFCMLLLTLAPMALGVVPFASPVSGANGTFPTVGDVPGASWQLYDDGTLRVDSGHIQGAGGTSPWIAHNTSIEQIIFTGSITGGSSLQALFAGLTHVETIEGLQYFNTENVTNMAGMFNGANSLVSLDVSTWNTSNVETMFSMFFGASSLTSLDVSAWNTGNVTDMRQLFTGTSSLTSLDVSAWNTGNVTTMLNMFNGASGLTELDLSRWDTSKVTDMNSMFNDARSLTCIGDVSGWDVSSVTNMNRMFQRTAFASLNLSGWDTGNVTNMDVMFNGILPLRELVLGEDFHFYFRNTPDGVVSPGLPAVQNNATYTGRWVNTRTGEALLAADLMNTFNGSESMIGTWAWQRHRQIAPLEDVYLTAVVGYNPAPTYTVAVTNIGGNPTGVLTVEVSADFQVSIDGGTTWSVADMLDSIGIDPGDDTVTFLLRPVLGHPTGIHAATVTVSGADLEPQSFTVTFTVEPSTEPEPNPDPWRPPVHQPPPDPWFPPPPPIETDEIHPAYMFGVPSGNFNPSHSLTRAEAATILARTQLLDFEHEPNRLPPGMTSFDTFGDVHPGQWHFYYIAWAYDAELVRGYAGNFRPNDPVTREELAAMIARVGTVHPTGDIPFYDETQISSWARTYVYTAYRESLMIGNNNLFHPADHITRAETATAFNRLLDRIDSRAVWYAATIANPEAARDFPDVASDAWYFPAVAGAANDQRLSWGSDGNVDWKEIVR